MGNSSHLPQLKALNRKAGAACHALFLQRNPKVKKQFTIVAAAFCAFAVGQVQLLPQPVPVASFAVPAQGAAYADIADLATIAGGLQALGPRQIFGRDLSRLHQLATQEIGIRPDAGGDHGGLMEPDGAFVMP